MDFFKLGMYFVIISQYHMMRAMCHDNLLDKVALQKDVVTLIRLMDMGKVNYLTPGSFYIRMAQGNSELAVDIHRMAMHLRTSEEQKIIVTFCEKWGLASIQR